MVGSRKSGTDTTRIGLPQARFETLLVATDFTRGANWAVRRATLLPLAPNAKVHILHVLPDGIPADVHGRADKDARRRLDKDVLPAFRTTKATGGTGAVATPVVQVGKPYVEIIREAHARAADLIVLGRYGQRTIRDLLLGSTAERVIRMGGTPILVVNRRPSHPYRRVLIAIDLGDTSHATVELALRAAGPGAAEVSIFHACGKPFQGYFAADFTSAELDAIRRYSLATSMSHIRRFLESFGDRGVRWRTSARYGDPRVEILREVERRRADLIVLCTHGRTGVSHALLGSVAEWIVAGRCATCSWPGRPQSLSIYPDPMPRRRHSARGAVAARGRTGS